MNPPIIICSTSGKALPVLMSSIEEYVPVEAEVYLFQKKTRVFNSDKGRLIYHYCNHGSTFGESYNLAVEEVFSGGYGSCIIANDDIVLRPDTYGLMLKDICDLKDKKPGYIAARADFARKSLNMCFASTADPYKIGEVSPYFAYITKEAWVDFPPINYWSDDIQGLDILNKGYQHYAGSFYVHHIGANTCKENAEKHVLESLTWIKQNRPDLYKLWNLNR
jgi:hypothetical protein